MRWDNGFTKFLLVVAIIGAINWGLIGVFNWNLVDAIFGGGSREQTSGLSRFVYFLVGASGVLLLVPLLKRSGRSAHRREQAEVHP